MLCLTALRSSGAGRSFYFYGSPETGVTDYDFKGKEHIRGHWIAKSIRLNLGMCRLAAPVLGWGQRWEANAVQTESWLGSLADEAERRYIEPLKQAAAKAPDWDLPASAT